MMTNTYELMVVYSPDIEADQKKAFSSLEKLVEARGGSVVSHELLGKRLFMYPIKKQVEGLYATWVVELPTSGPAALENDLRVNEQVLRHLLIRTKSQGLGAKDQVSREEPEKVAKKVTEKKTVVKKPVKVSKKKTS